MQQRVFTVGTFYRHVRNAMANALGIVRARRAMGGNLASQLMLAVSQVNGCRLCSWFHTSVALKEGATEGELQDLIGGDFGHLTDEQAACVLFAQHYADQGGLAIDEAFADLIHQVGETTARHTLALTQAIMVGNLHGIALDALTQRARGHALGGSRALHELGISIGGLVLPLIAVPHNLVSGVPSAKSG